MKRGILLLGAVLLLTTNGLAQQRVGFSNTDNIDPLLDYRLPDWGYDNLFFDFRINGDYMRNDASSSGFDSDEESQNFATAVNPNYVYYRESEQRIIELNTSASFQYNTRKRELDGDNTHRRFFNEQIRVSGMLREYFQPKWFLLGSQVARLSHSNTLTDQADWESEDIIRNIYSGTTLGIGYGRVRNVNPVIRALRLKERLGVISDGASLSDREVASAAGVFTRYDGFQRRYDRPEKYFWQAMDQALNGAVSNMEPFDLFYARDVMEENIGYRLEGWDVTAGSSFDYRNYLSRSEDRNGSEGVSFNRRLEISKLAVFFTEGRWFKNISLRHQINVQGEVSREYGLSDNSLYDTVTNAGLSAGWLWNITDRVLVNTIISNRYSANDISSDVADNSYSSGGNLRRNSFSAASNLTYFIENRVAIDAGIQYERNSGDTAPFLVNEDDRVFQFNAGLRYYFSRNLYR